MNMLDNINHLIDSVQTVQLLQQEHVQSIRNSTTKNEKNIRLARIHDDRVQLLEVYDECLAPEADL